MGIPIFIIIRKILLTAFFLKLRTFVVVASYPPFFCHTFIMNYENIFKAFWNIVVCNANIHAHIFNARMVCVCTFCVFSVYSPSRSKTVYLYLELLCICKLHTTNMIYYPHFNDIIILNIPH